jgi:hypothetical protein
MKEKKSTSTFHALIPLYTYYHMQLRCDYFGHTIKGNDVLPHVLIFYYYYYYFE